MVCRISFSKKIFLISNLDEQYYLFFNYLLILKYYFGKNSVKI